MSCRKLSLETKRGVFSTNHNVTEEHAMENTFIFKTQKSKHDDIRNKENAYHFLRCQEYCLPRIRPTRLSGQPGSLCRNIDDIARSGAWKKAQQLISPSSGHSNSPYTLCQSRYSCTIYCWTGTYPVFTRSGSQLILALYRIITHFDGTNISTPTRSEKCVVSAEDYS